MAESPVLYFGRRSCSSFASSSSERFKRRCTVLTVTPTTSAASSGLITFQVSPPDALRVESAAKAGTLYLSLRPLGASGSATVPASGR